MFPEFSLTGSVDPLRHPERAVAVDSGPVRALVAETRRTGVAAVFGIAERAGASFHITQLYAHGGRLLGRYRKRHLGEDEQGYRTGSEPGVFELGDALRHARELGLWVAMATQAGSTEDEDFPGLAALVRPDGEVVARLPDWRPGTLVVDVPVAVEVEPVREAVRALVVDGEAHALLVRFEDQRTGASWWAPPGGGLEPGEDHLAAVRRELREELDRDDLVVGPWIGRRSHTFAIGEGWMTQRERWLLCRTERFPVDPDHVATLGWEHIHDLRWWSAEELRAAGAVTTPRRLAGILDDLREGHLPDADAELGV